MTPIGSFSRSQRETWSTIGSPARSGRPSHTVARRFTRSGVPSSRGNVGTGAVVLLAEPGGVQDRRARSSGSSSWFLAEKASITGAIRLILSSLEPLPDEGLAREDVGVRLLDVRAQEPPGPARQVAGSVDPDVAAPDHRDPALLERGDEPGGLGVVDDHDVVVGHQLEEFLDVRAKRLVVDPPLLVAELAAVARRVVQVVVDPLRQGEERVVAGDDDPPGVHAGSVRVGEQRHEHLGHPAAPGRGVDVPDGPAREHAAAAFHGVTELARSARPGESTRSARREDDRWEPTRVLAYGHPNQSQHGRGAGVRSDYEHRHPRPGPRPTLHQRHPHAVDGRRAEGELRAPRHADGPGPRGLCALHAHHAPQPGQRRLARPRPLRPVRRPRLDAPLLVAVPVRLRADARRPQELPPARLADRRPSRVRPRRRHRDDDRAAGPGHLQLGRPRAGRAHARGAFQPRGPRDRRPPHLRDRLRRRHGGGSPVRGLRRWPATSASAGSPSSTTTTTSRSRATPPWPSPRTSASATRPTAGTSRTSARTSSSTAWRARCARRRAWRTGPR